MHPSSLLRKRKANARFKAGEYIEAIKGYDAALAIPPPSNADAAICHSNAAQALLNLAAADAPRREACAAEALRRGMQAVEVDETNFKAYMRCVAACEILNEHAAADEFKAKADACAAANNATKDAKHKEIEESQNADATMKAAFDRDKAAKATRTALLKREMEHEREKEQIAAPGSSFLPCGKS